MFSRAHGGDTQETPPEAVIKTPVLITTLLGEENQTDNINNEKLTMISPITLLESEHRHRSEPSED